MTTPGQLTVRVKLAVDHRRRTEQRRYPLPGHTRQIVRLTGVAPVLVMQARRLGPRPPQIVAPASTFALTVNTATGLLTNWRKAQQRRATYFLGEPILPAAAFIAPPVIVALAAGLLVNQRRLQQRRASYSVLRPTTLRVFPGPQVTTVATQTRVQRQRRRLPQSTLQPPFFYPQTGEISVQLVRTRPRPTRRILSYTAYPATSEIAVALARSRPRATRKTLAPPAALQVFVEPVEAEVAVRVPLEDRRRLPHSRLPAVIVPAAAFVAEPVSVELVRIRPRPTRRLLQPPAALRVFGGPVETEVAVRTPVDDKRRPSRSRLAPPATLEPESVALAERTVRVALTRARPRPTAKRLGLPAALRTFPGPTVAVVRARPRPTAKTLGEPGVLLVPSVEARRRAVTVALVRARPRRTYGALEAPTVVLHPPQAPIRSALAAVRTRAEAKRRFPLQGWRQRLVRETGSAATYQQIDPLLGPRPPTVIDPLPSQRVETVAVVLVAVRGRAEAQRRAPRSSLRLAIFRPPLVAALAVKTARTRVEQGRRAARSNLAEPAVAARAAFFGPDVTVVRARPRPRTHRLGPPVFYPATSRVSVALVRARPRATRHSLASVSYPSAGRTDVTLAGRTRIADQRRAPRHRLAAPVVVGVPAVEQRQDTVSVQTVRARPRPTSHRLLAPVVRAAVFAAGHPAVVRVRPPRTASRVQPPATVGESRPPERPELATQLTRASLLRRDAHARLQPPAVVAPTPLPTADQRTIHVTLADEARVGIIRRRPRTLLPLTIPPPPAPGFTSGYTIATGAGALQSVADGAAESLSLPAAAAAAEDAARGRGSIESVEAAAGEISDQPGGIPT